MSPESYSILEYLGFGYFLLVLIYYVFSLALSEREVLGGAMVRSVDFGVGKTKRITFIFSQETANPY